MSSPCPGSLRCTKKKLCGTRLSVKAYTPLWYPQGGACKWEDKGEPLSFWAYLRVLVCFSYSLSPDVCVPLTGVARKLVQRVFSYLMTVCSWAEEQRCLGLYFGEGHVELDSTRVLAERTDPAVTVHLGRMLGITKRETREVAYFQLPNKQTAKGAASPPESYEEVKDPVLATVGKDIFLCVDGAQVWKKLAKRDLDDAPVASTNHLKKQYSKWVKVTVKKKPFPKATAIAQARVKGRKVKNPRKVGVRAGDNLIEAKFGAVKRKIRRRNGLQNPKNAGAQFLTASWLGLHPGPEGVGKALRAWLLAKVDETDPKLAWSPGKARDKDAATPVAPVKKRPAAK